MANESKQAQLDFKTLELTEDGKVVIDDPELFASLSELRANGELEEEGSTNINIYKCGTSLA